MEGPAIHRSGPGDCAWRSIVFYFGALLLRLKSSDAEFMQ